MKHPRYVCIHGHFYQPPRENPWLDVVEVQDSAAPFHDWNERITRECYAPNTPRPPPRRPGADHQPAEQLRLDELQLRADAAAVDGRRAPPRSSRGIVEADRLSRERRGGHGNALAQVYNHMIMPLASRARQGDAGALGHRRLPPPVRPRARGDVAGRDGRRRRPRWRSWPRPASGSRSWRPHQAAALAASSARRTGSRSPAGIDPSRAYLLPAPLGPVDRALLLRRHRLARRRLRAAARRRRAVPATGSSRGSTTAASTPSSCTSPPTASRTATTTRTATWRWPTCSTS